MHQPIGAAPPILPAEPLAELSLPLPAPHPALQACVVVPAKDEETTLPALIAALAGQRERCGRPLRAQEWEVILLLNNCTDGSAAVARQLRQAWPQLRLHVAEIVLPPAEAHVGRARRLLFDTAHARFCSLGRPEGLILTTDADTLPAPDWIASLREEFAAGVEGVGGRICLHREELEALPPAVRRLFLLDIGYRRALEEMRHLYAPEAHDPFPRHHQHFGGSMGVTSAAYGRAGGMPPARSSEDVALYRAVLETGGRFRHSFRVRAWTSARFAGRARGGLADALVWWQEQATQRTEVLVEDAAAAELRLARLALRRLAHPHTACPAHLMQPPEPPDPRHAAEIAETLQELRQRLSLLRGLNGDERLVRARSLAATSDALVV